MMTGRFHLGPRPLFLAFSASLLLLAAQALPQEASLALAAGRQLEGRSRGRRAPARAELNVDTPSDLRLVAGKQVPQGIYAEPERPGLRRHGGRKEPGSGRRNDEEEAVAGGGREAAGEEASGEEASSGEGEGEQERVRPAERAYSFSLIGSVVLVMSLFYLVNWHDPDIRLNTWQTLSMTISIFGSVLIYGSVKSVIKEFLGIYSEEGITYLNFVMFLVCLIALQVLLYTLKGSKNDLLLPSVGTIFAHLTGFAAMYCGAGFQAVDGIKDSLLSISLVIVAMAGVLAFVTLAGARLRESAASMRGGITEADERWMDQVEEVEDDIVSLCVGFAIMQVVRFAITGKLHPYEANEPPEDIQQWEANALLLGGGCMGLLTCLGSYVVGHAEAERRLSGPARRLFTAFRNVSSMCVAWCMLFWAEWQIYALGYKGIRIGACLAIAVLVSVSSVFSIIVLDFIADQLAHQHRDPRALRSMILSLGLAVGFTWERAFDMGLDKFSLHHFPHEHQWMRHIPPVALALLVLPAWSWYILPNALGKKHKQAQEG